MNNERRRGGFLTVMAVLLGILAFSDFTKALQHLRNPARLGIVIFGVRFESLFANLTLGPMMGVLIAAYAYGIWNLRRWAAPLSVFYAFYVPVNLVLFWFRQAGVGDRSLGFMIVYLAFAYTGSIGTALYLAYHRELLA